MILCPREMTLRSVDNFKNLILSVEVKRSSVNNKSRGSDCAIKHTSVTSRHSTRVGKRAFLLCVSTL